MKTQEDVVTLLRTEETYNDVRAAQARALLADFKRTAVQVGDEITATLMWTREQALCAHLLYQQAFSQLKAYDYHGGWCTLERAEIALNSVRRHVNDQDWTELHLDFVATQVEQWQSLFPYTLFLSPEIIQHEKRCSICGATVGFRAKCKHRKGQVYGGELCIHIVRRAEIISISLVTKPVQKYSTLEPFELADGKDPGKTAYLAVRYTIDRLQSPYHSWRAHKGTRRHSHALYAAYKSSGLCPCGGTKLYSECCLSEPGVLRPHIDIEFDVSPPEELLVVEYSEAPEPSSSTSRTG